MPKPAEQLLGKTLNGGWKVVQQIQRAPGATGGRFSEGYIAESPKGKRAYLKALDYSSALQSSDPARELEKLTAAYNFERDLLAKCKDKKLDRIVVSLADGSIS